MAIGVYGSIGADDDLPYSDIEMYVITSDETPINGHEFIYDKFKIEISMNTKTELFKKALQVDDSWPIKAGSFIHILPVYDPQHIFGELKQLRLRTSDSAVRNTVREFLIWQPYETNAKIRNNFMIKNYNYIPMGAKDLTWQSAKLIGLANKKYFSTRAKTWEESIQMDCKPEGYVGLATCVMSGELSNTEYIYQLCENLWTGLNVWYEELGIEYKVRELPLFK